MSILNLFKSEDTIKCETVISIIKNSNVSGLVSITDEITEVMIVKNTVNRFEKVIYVKGAIINPVNVVQFCKDNKVKNIELFTKTLLNKLQKCINTRLGNSDMLLERTLLAVR